MHLKLEESAYIVITLEYSVFLTEASHQQIRKAFALVVEGRNDANPRELMEFNEFKGAMRWFKAKVHEGFEERAYRSCKRNEGYAHLLDWYWLLSIHHTSFCYECLSRNLVAFY